MEHFTKIPLLMCVGLLGFFVGAVLSFLAVFFGCWLLTKLFEDPSAGGVISYLGSFAALGASIYGGIHGMIYAIQYAQTKHSIREAEWQDHDDFAEPGKSDGWLE